METPYSPPDIYTTKNINKRVILDVIRFTPGGISRAEIARRMDLTRSAVTTIIHDLMEDELVREAENGPFTGGRRPIMLEINPERSHVVGIDLGASHLRLALADFSARVLNELEVNMDIRLGPEVCLPVVDQNFHKLLSHACLTVKDVSSVGIGVPGPVVAEKGAVCSPPIMPGWDEFPIRDHLQELWGCPVNLGNDAELGAIGEWAYGAGRGEHNLAYIKVGTGVGAGLLLNGQVYRGTTGCAGEIGHVTIMDGGPRCTCGNFGCLEALAGGQAIANQAKEAVRSGRRTHLASVHPIETITAKDVGEAARLGDLVAQKIVTTAGACLGTAIASLVNLLNPGTVVVGGGVAEMGDLLLEPIRQTVRARSLRSASQSLRITTAVLGRRSTLVGAVVEALKVALTDLAQ